jgi:dipeptidyl-peptidase-4
MQWTNDSNVLSAQVLNRHKIIWIYYLLTEQLDDKSSLNEKDKAYVDVTDNLTFLNDNSFIWTSEKTVLIISTYTTRTENYAIK